MATNSEVIDLARSLRQEQLFINSERKEIQNLTEKIQKCSERLYQSAWVARHQRINLDRYTLSLQEIHQTHRTAFQYDQVEFIDSYKKLGIHDTAIADLIQSLRDSPKLLALFLDRLEQHKTSAATLQSVVNSVMISVFGGGLLGEDTNSTLVLLYELMHIQLPRSDQLRRMLQHGCCIFSRCYKAFAESHLPAKLFLTAALRQAIVQVLVNDDLYLDIDSNKAVIRFAPEERLRHFGPEGTPEYFEKVNKYRQWTIRKLVGLAQHFLDGIKDSIFSFPSSLAWIVTQLYNIILEENKMEPKQIGTVCADLIFAFLICPAIVNPELYGIIEKELHISKIARFNLIQIAQIIQVLAMCRYEPIEARLDEVYSHFDKDSMADILEQIIQGNNNFSNDELNQHLDGQPSRSDSSRQYGPLVRTAILISPSELQDLVGALHYVREHEIEGSLLEEWLKPLLVNVPSIIPGCSQPPTATTSAAQTPDAQLKKALLNKMSKIRPHAASSVSRFSGTGSGNGSAGLESSGETVTLDDNSFSSTSIYQQRPELLDVCSQVLVISLPQSQGRNENPGFLSEERVLSMEQSKRSATRVRLDLSTVDKKTNCSDPALKNGSVSPDQESIAGASDNLEAVSEAASEAASVASSLEMEENAENDNLSDMVSANVSGPGTPSVSGRDTPSSHGAAPTPIHPSQIVEQMQLMQVAGAAPGGHGVSGDNQRGLQPMQQPAAAFGLAPTRRARHHSGGNQNQKQMDIEDRFGRFGLSNNNTNTGSSLTEEETKSMVSDTWSTDVLASSDSEAINNDQQAQQQQLESHLSALQQHIYGHLSQHNVQQLMDLSETASDAWSTAAMTSFSDADRLQDIEQEDQNDDNMFAGVDRRERRRSGDRLDGASGTRRGPGSEGSSDTSGLGRSMAADLGPLDGIPGGEANLPGPSGAAASMAQLAGLAGPEDVSSNGGKGDGQSTPTNLMDSLMLPHHSSKPVQSVNPPNEDGAVANLIDIDDQVVELRRQRDLNLNSARNESSNMLASVLSSNGFTSGGAYASLDGCQEQEEGSQSLGRLSFAMKESTPVPENSIDNEPGEIGMIKIDDLDRLRTGMDSSDGNSESSLDAAASGRTGATGSKGPLVGFASPSTNSSGRPWSTAGPSSSGMTEEEKQKHMSAGAIPKTPKISFQPCATTDRDRDIRSDRQGDRGSMRNRPFSSQKSNFLKKIGSIKQQISSKVKTLDRNSAFGRKLPNSHSQEAVQRANAPMDAEELEEDNLSPPRANSASQFMEASDILEKYRNKRSDVGPGSSTGAGIDNTSTFSGDLLDLDESETSSQCLEEMYIQDAKKKLRSVFSSTNLQFRTQSLEVDSDRTNLILLLKMLLAEALSLQENGLTSQLHETIRVVSRLDAPILERVVDSMREDYRQRSSYISYLVRSRQGLTTTLSNLQILLKHIEKDKSVSHMHLATLCVEDYLQRRDGESMEALVRQFKCCTAADEKVSVVDTYMNLLTTGMRRSPPWNDADQEDFVQFCEAIIERIVMGKVYVHALFPNGDGDMMRDQVLHDHMKRLSQIITPNHRNLLIPKMYHLECPWPSAQAEIIAINAYKAPRDKMTCVSKCCSTIMALLSLSGNNVPAADDLVPVLVYVVIKANPCFLLSTIQFVNAFYEKYCEGELGYWWTQFCGAVEFIKTMDYT